MKQLVEVLASHKCGQDLRGYDFWEKGENGGGEQLGKNEFYWAKDIEVRIWGLPKHVGLEGQSPREET